MREAKEDIEDTVRKSIAESTTGQDADAVPKAEPEHTFEGNLAGVSEDPAKDKLRQEAVLKEPAKDA